MVVVLVALKPSAKVMALALTVLSMVIAAGATVPWAALPRKVKLAVPALPTDCTLAVASYQTASVHSPEPVLFHWRVSCACEVTRAASQSAVAVSGSDGRRTRLVGRERRAVAEGRRRYIVKK